MRESNPGIVLLDTHIWLWFILRSPELSTSSLVPKIEKGLKNSNVKLSAISVWEIAMLEAKGRISLNMSCLEWIRQGLLSSGIGLVALSPEIAVESTRLPGSFHSDPADRMIVATARILNAVLVTRDCDMISYATAHSLRILQG